MHPIEERYYKINRIVLKILGIWPYERTCFTRIHNVLFICIAMICILSQLLVFTTQFNIHLLLMVLSLAFPTIIITIKYLFFVQADNSKQLLQQIRNDWSLLKDDVEIDIIKKYACHARFCTITVVAFYYFGMFVLAICQFWPLILDVILPLNKSRPCQLIIVAEYYVDQEKYFYVLLLHEIITVYIGINIICGTATIMMIHILHTCALFNIASYRIENAVDEAALALPIPTKECLFYRRIIRAVGIHRRAIKSVAFITSSCALLYPILIPIGVSSLSLNLFYFFQVITLEKNVIQTLIIAQVIIYHIFYMYIANYSGQIIIDHDIQFFKATYNGLWYMAPLHTQKLLLFIMQKEMINFNITFGGIYVASLKGFATLVNAAASYFTLMYSKR